MSNIELSDEWPNMALHPAAARTGAERPRVSAERSTADSLREILGKYDRKSRRRELVFSKTPVSVTVLLRGGRLRCRQQNRKSRSCFGSLPDDATLEDIQYHICVKRKIAQGLADVRAGRVVSHEAVEKRFARWLEK